MMQWILANVPPEGIGLVVTLFLSLMIPLMFWST